MAVHYVVRENHAPHFYGNVKLGLHISMETGPATQSPVAEVEPCRAGGRLVMATK